MNLLKKMARDMAFLKKKVSGIEVTINEIDADIHREVSPEYLKKLAGICKEEGVKFNDMDEFDKYFSA